MFCYDDDLRHEKSRDHATIGSRTILRLWEDKGSNTLEFVEAINLIFMDFHNSIGVRERSKLA
jgi:hypothetical protein